jgi:hypothetical protein
MNDVENIDKKIWFIPIILHWLLNTMLVPWLLYIIFQNNFHTSDGCGWMDCTYMDKNTITIIFPYLLIFVELISAFIVSASFNKKTAVINYFFILFSIVWKLILMLLFSTILIGIPISFFFARSWMLGSIITQIALILCLPTLVGSVFGIIYAKSLMIKKAV